jgi:hypothetical protein
MAVKFSRLSTAAVLVMAGMAGSGIGVMAQPANASTGHAAPVVRLAVSAATRQDFRKIYAAYRHVPASDVARIKPVSVHGARVTRTGTDWAVISLQPSLRAPLNIRVGFQDGAANALLTRSPGHAWKVTGLGRGPLGCDTRIPSSVRKLWRFSSCPAATPSPLRTRPSAVGSASVPAAATTGGIAAIANSEVGVSDNPPESAFNTIDCNPFTALETPSAPDSGCKTDPKFNILDHSELWCSDFAKYVWTKAGVTSDASTLNGLSSSFYTWGLAHGESMPVDGTNAQVGDAMVLYPSGTSGTAGLKADGDHVGIVTAVHSNGTIDIVNGDFLWSGFSTIQVIKVSNISPATFAPDAENPGEEWVFVSPQVSSGSSGGDLWLRDSSGSQMNTTAGMMPGTSPSVAALTGGGYEVAFQANNGHLWLRNSAGSQTDTTAGMEPGTSPSITAVTGGGYEVAFQANDGDLWLRNSAGSQANTTAGMAAATSPSITGVAGGGFEVAFQANTGTLWLRDSSGSQSNTTAGMEPGTSPSIAGLVPVGYEVAFQANNGHLWLRNSDGSQADTTAGMENDTSPSIASVTGGTYEVAFQANTKTLWLRNGAGSQANTSAGMIGGSSPQVTGLTGGGFEVAFQANTGTLWLRNSAGSQANTTAGMASLSSPAIAGLSSGGYEAAFQDNS